MSTTLPPASLPHADTVPPLHRFTVEEYLQLSRIGVVHADDNLELIEGVIVDKMTQNPPHAVCVTRLNRLLLQQLDDRWSVRSQTVLGLADSLPEPDFVIAVGPDDRYARSHPAPADTALVIEVSHDTLQYDRRTKGRVYARAGVARYWIVNLVDRQIEQYADPDSAAVEPSYRLKQVYREHETVTFQPDGKTTISLKVADTLPPP